MILDWWNEELPPVKFISDNYDNILPGYVRWINTKTGEYISYGLDFAGYLIIIDGQILIWKGKLFPPIHVEWDLTEWHEYHKSIRRFCK